MGIGDARELVEIERVERTEAAVSYDWVVERWPRKIAGVRGATH
jgi:hypothetical protein